MIFSNVKDITLPEGNVIQIAVNKQAHWNKRITDDTVAYTKDVPKFALPFAKLQKLGGMTRKCTNLLNMSNFGGGSGVINADGSVSITSGNSVIYPSAELTGVLPSGTYNLTNINGNGCYVAFSISDYGNFVGIGQNKSFTYDGSSYLEIRYIEHAANTTVTYKAMLNTGATALPYEPYFEGLRSAPVTSVESVGANLWSRGDVSGVTNTARAISLPAGSYSMSCFITSSDTDYTSNRVTVNLADGTNKALFFERNQTSINSFTVNSDIVGFTFAASSSNTPSEGDSFTFANIMLNKGSTALPYAPYTKFTLPIPEAVRPANGINDTVYDFIEWNGEKNTTTKTKAVEKIVFDGTENITLRGQNAAGLNAFLCSINPFAKIAPLSTDFDFVEFVTGASTVLNGSATDGAFYMLYNSSTSTFNSVYFISAQATVEDFKQSIIGKSITYALATPEVTDISDLITADNLIPVQGNGTITFVNEYGYAVPSSVKYTLGVTDNADG